MATKAVAYWRTFIARLEDRPSGRSALVRIVGRNIDIGSLLLWLPVEREHRVRPIPHACVRDPGASQIHHSTSSLTFG
jgi:hypothetical protein